MAKPFFDYSSLRDSLFLEVEAAWRGVGPRQAASTSNIGEGLQALSRQGKGFANRI